MERAASREPGLCSAANVACKAGASKHAESVLAKPGFGTLPGAGRPMAGYESDCPPFFGCEHAF